MTKKFGICLVLVLAMAGEAVAQDQQRLSSPKNVTLKVKRCKGYETPLTPLESVEVTFGELDVAIRPGAVKKFSHYPVADISCELSASPNELQELRIRRKNLSVSLLMVNGKLHGDFPRTDDPSQKIHVICSPASRDGVITREAVGAAKLQPKFENAVIEDVDCEKPIDAAREKSALDRALAELAPASRDSRTSERSGSGKSGEAAHTESVRKAQASAIN